MKRFLEKKYRWIIFLALTFMLTSSFSNAWWDSAIFDETAHIPAGYSYLRYSDMRLNPEHPPLIKDLAALPLIFMDLNFEENAAFWTKDINGQWDAGRSFLWKVNNNPDAIIFFSRLPIILLSLILGLVIFFWTKQLAGKLAALFALILYSFDPNILGHNHFVTTDIGIALFITLAFYFYLKFIKEPTWKSILLAGIFLGLLQLAKFSSVVTFPILGIITILYPLVKINPAKNIPNWKFKSKELLKYFFQGALVFAISLVAVWGVYFLNTRNMPEEKLNELINYQFNPENYSDQQDIQANQFLSFLNKNYWTRPLSEYFLGIGMVFKRVEGGNSAYFMGQVSSLAFVEYFPIVFLIKTPLPTLFLILVALLGSIFLFFKNSFRLIKNNFKKIPERITHYLRTEIATVSMLLFIVLYSYLSITGNLNIGLRHLFPIFSFVFILISKTIFSFIRKSLNKTLDSVLYAGIFFLAVFLILETIFVFPNYMSYFNVLAGGPKNGYRYVTDSNADWGQDLKRLEYFLELHPEIKDIHVDYFGGADPMHYLGGKYLPWWDSRRPIEAGWYAISTNFLQGSLYDKNKPDNESYRWLKSFSPKYQIGTSILIYEITEKDLQ